MSNKRNEKSDLQIDGIEIIPQTQVSKFEAVENVSLKEIGQSVEGYLLGFINQLNDNEQVLTIVYLYNTVLGRKLSFIAGYQVTNFLQSTGYKSGYWLKVTKVAEVETKKGYRLSQFSIEYDENGCTFQQLSFNHFDVLKKTMKLDEGKKTNETETINKDLVF